MTTLATTLTPREENYLVSVIYKQCLTSAKEQAENLKRIAVQESGLLHPKAAHEKALDIIRKTEAGLIREFNTQLNAKTWRYIKPEQELQLRTEGCIPIELYGRMVATFTKELTDPHAQSSGGFISCAIV